MKTEIFIDKKGDLKETNTELPDVLELSDIKVRYGQKYVIGDVSHSFNLLIEDKPNQGQFVRSCDIGKIY